MSTKFVEYRSGQDNDCLPCYYWKNDCMHPKGIHAPCCKSKRKDGRNGYFVAVKSKKRAGKYERLLKALLNNCEIVYYVGGNFIQCIEHPKLSKTTTKQLIAIKQRLDKKGKQ